MAQLPVANLSSPLPLINNLAGFPSATSVVRVANTKTPLGSFPLGMLPVAYLRQPLVQWNGLLAGNPNAVVIARISPTVNPLADFSPNTDIDTEWPNPLFVTPVKPLPINGSGGGGGPVGYAF